MLPACGSSASCRRNFGADLSITGDQSSVAHFMARAPIAKVSLVTQSGNAPCNEDEAVQASTSLNDHGSAINAQPLRSVASSCSLQHPDNESATAASPSESSSAVPLSSEKDDLFAIVKGTKLPLSEHNLTMHDQILQLTLMTSRLSSQSESKFMVHARVETTDGSNLCIVACSQPFVVVSKLLRIHLDLNDRTSNQAVTDNRSTHRKATQQSNTRRRSLKLPEAFIVDQLKPEGEDVSPLGSFSQQNEAFQHSESTSRRVKKPRRCGYEVNKTLLDEKVETGHGDSDIHGRDWLAERSHSCSNGNHIPSAAGRGKKRSHWSASKQDISPQEDEMIDSEALPTRPTSVLIENDSQHACNAHEGDVPGELLQESAQQSRQVMHLCEKQMLEDQDLDDATRRWEKQMGWQQGSEQSVGYQFELTSEEKDGDIMRDLPSAKLEHQSSTKSTASFFGENDKLGVDAEMEMQWLPFPEIGNESLEWPRKAPFPAEVPETMLPALCSFDINEDAGVMPHPTHENLS